TRDQAQSERPQVDLNRDPRRAMAGPVPRGHAGRYAVARRSSPRPAHCKRLRGCLLPPDGARALAGAARAGKELTRENLATDHWQRVTGNRSLATGNG